jgi:ribose transport system substrate-binding protein
MSSTAFRRVRVPSVVVGLATLAVAVSACGSDDDASTAGSSTSAAAGAVSPEVAAKLDEARAVPKFKAPGPTIDVSPLKGKTIYFIPFSSGAEFPQLQGEGVQEAAKVAGVNVKVYTNNGVPSQWQQGIDRAVAEKAAAIIIGADPHILAPQIAKAKAAGIPVLVSHAVDTTLEEKVTSEVPGTYIGARAPFTDATRLIADYVAEQSEGKGNVLYVSQDDMVGYMPAMVKAFEDELATVCPDCEVTVASTTFAEAATKTPTAVQAALRKDPSIDWVVPSFDNLTPFVLSALRVTGKSDSVKIATFNGTPSVLKDISEDGPVVMDIGEPAVVAGYSALDQAMRLALDDEPVDEVPYMRLFDAGNVADAGNPPEATKGYGDPATFLDGFKKVWGIQP